MDKEFIVTTDDENERVRVVMHLLLKTLALNNIPDYIGMIAMGKASLVIAEVNEYDDEDVRHLLNQFYKLYLEATQRG